ncbi:Zinc finger, CCHC-type, partial [Corchorus capsularis]
VDDGKPAVDRDEDVRTVESSSKMDLIEISDEAATAKSSQTESEWRSKAEEYKMISDLTGFDYLRAMMEGEATVNTRKRRRRRGRWKKKKKKKMSNESLILHFPAQQPLPVNAGKPDEDVRTVEVSKMNLIEISDDEVPHKIIVDADEKMIETVQAVKSRAESNGVEVGSREIIDLCSSSSEDDSFISNISFSKSPQQMVSNKSTINEDGETVRRMELKTDIVQETADAGKKKMQHTKHVVTVKPTEAESTGNTVLQKLLRKPRYFDFPNGGWDGCLRCGEDHPTAPANCTLQKQVKPCFLCGSLQHNGKHCIQGKYCFVCRGRSGHQANGCPENQENDSTQIICLRCGDSGHDMFSCTSDYSPDDLKKIRCYVCNDFGHLSCANIPDTSSTDISCYNCGLCSHLGSECTNLPKVARASNATKLCYRMKAFGVICRSPEPPECETADNHTRKTNYLRLFSLHSSLEETMDFHSLTRKELQTLCKQNKIPANITNVAMADALKALETVEGLDEIMNQSQSPQKTIDNSSQDILSTATRASTRRKTTKEEPQSTQPTTRSRRMTKTTVELDEENRNVNVPETPLMAATSTTTRRRAAVGSTRRKVEAQKEEGSVQHTYGTRRSVRLLEKCMAGLSLKNDEMVEEKKKGQSGAVSEVALARNLSASLEDENDLKDDALENSKSHDNGDNEGTVASEADSQKSSNFDGLSALDAKGASHHEETKESDAYLSKSETKLAYMPDETIDPKGSDDVAVSGDTNEIDNSKEEAVVAENNGGSHANETKSTEVLVAEACKDISEDILDQASSAEFEEPREVESGEDKEQEDEECDEGKVSQDLHEDFVDSSKELGHKASEDVSDIADGFGADSDDDSSFSGNGSSADEQLLKEVSSETDYNCSVDPVNEVALIDVNVAEAEMSAAETSFNNAPQSVAAGGISMNKILDHDDEEAFVDVCIKPAEEFSETTLIIPQQEKSPIAAKLTSPSPSLSLASNSEITSFKPLSPPPLTAQSSQPTRFTPRKSSSRKQATDPKTVPISDINKENIDNNSEKEVVEPRAKVMEKPTQNFDAMSIRGLKKLIKKLDKLQIAENVKNKEEKNDNKQPFGKTRPALQLLPQNCMPCGETEKEN